MCLDYFKDLMANVPFSHIWTEYKEAIILGVSGVGIIGLVIYLAIKNKG